MSDDFVQDDGGSDAGTTAWVNPDPDGCPVIPLGFDGAYVWFALPEGALRRELSSKLSGMLRTDIYASIEGAAWLGQWRDGEGKIQLVEAARWLVRTCRDRGLWDSSRPQRGYGVWPSADGPIIHAGDAIGRWPFKAADWTPVAKALREAKAGPIWVLRPPAPRPEKPASARDGQALREAIALWNFAPIGDDLSGPDVLIGWLGVVLLGGAPPFRPHMAVNGGRGTGKTTLSRLMQAAASANAGDLLDTFTEAGIRNSLSGEARGLFLDETEPSHDGTAGPVEKVMELLRRMSTGEGSAGVKGDIGGRTVATSAVGCAYLASIAPVPLGDAMATRMVEVGLRPLGAAKGGMDEALKAAIDTARDTSPALLARAVRDWDRYRSDLRLLKAAFGATGQDARGADLVAALAAGRRLMLFDVALDETGAAEEVRRWLALVKGREATATGQNPGEACLSRIWTINSGQHRGDRHLTLGEMVAEEMESRGLHEKVLKTWGLKVENGWAGSERVGPWLIVSTNHPALARALERTPFGNWTGVLKQLADKGDDWAPRPMDKAVRFGLHQSRALAVPLTPWLERPVVVGADPREASPFDEPDWGGASQPASRPASHDGTPDV